MPTTAETTESASDGLVRFATDMVMDEAPGQSSTLTIKWELIGECLPDLFRGVGYTLTITVCAVALGVALGMLIAICRVSRRWWWRAPATAYVEFFRGTPMLVQILLVYFVVLPTLGVNGDAVLTWIDDRGIGDWLKGHWFGWLYSFMEVIIHDGVIAGIMALGLNSGAYLGEIFRGGILAVDKGQREAALSLGMTEPKVFRYVVLPQAFVNALPAIANEFVTLIKDSSLCSAIAVMELTHRADLIAARTYERATMYLGIAALYFVMTFLTSRGLAWLEKRLRVP